MRFHLFYEGPILSGKVDVRDGERDKRSSHKHKIRRDFHYQLKDLWAERRFLKDAETNGEILGLAGTEKRLLSQALLECSQEVNGYRFVPLVHERLGLTCSLKILLQRKDRPGRIVTDSRDIDNRLKIVFDALKSPKDQVELGEESPLEDGSDNPLYVLLQDDSLITRVSVDTDDIYGVPQEHKDNDSYARAIIEVRIGVWDRANLFNIGFLAD